MANRDKNPAAIFFFYSPPSWGKRSGGRGRAAKAEEKVGFRACQHGQKTNAAVAAAVFRLFQASFVWRWVFLPCRPSSLPSPPPFSRTNPFPAAGGGPTRWKGCGRYGVAWLERPHLNATGKGLSALSSLRLCRATYATRRHFTAMMGP